MLPKSWEKLFIRGVFIPTKKRFCNECTDKLTCNRCNSQVKATKEFDANLGELKRQHPNQFGHILRYSEE